MHKRKAFWTSDDKEWIGCLMRRSEWLMDDPERRAAFIEKGRQIYCKALMKDNYNFLVSTLSEMIKERRIHQLFVLKR